MLVMFAQAAADALAGGSGWAGAGLLGMVLAWLLLRHLPAKDAQIERMIEDQRAQIERSEDLARQERAEKRAEFEGVLKAERDAFTAALKDVTASITGELRRLGERIDGLYPPRAPK